MLVISQEVRFTEVDQPEKISKVRYKMAVAARQLYPNRVQATKTLTDWIWANFN